MRPPRSGWAWFGITVRVLGIAFFVGMAVIMVLLGIRWVLLSTEPGYWGTYIEESCEPRFRGGCNSVGSWTSDDGSIMLTDVELDGETDGNGTAWAYYMPNEREPGDAIVHIGASLGIAPIVFPGAVIWMLGCAFYYGRKWWGWGRRKRANSP